MHLMPRGWRLDGYTDLVMSVILVVSKPLPTIVIHCDSRTTIDKISIEKYNAKTKRHIQVRLKYIRGLVFDRIIAIESLKLRIIWLIL